MLEDNGASHSGLAVSGDACLRSGSMIIKILTRKTSALDVCSKARRPAYMVLKTRNSERGFHFHSAIPKAPIRQQRLEVRGVENATIIWDNDWVL